MNKFKPVRPLMRAFGVLGFGVMFVGVAWADYVILDLGTLGGSTSRAYAINNNGDVVGYSTTTSGSGGGPHAFFFNFNSGTMSDLGTLGGSRSYAFAINSNGYVVGDSDLASPSQHALYYAGGLMSDLGTLGGDSSARSINDNGDAVGYSFFTSFSQTYMHASLYTSGVVSDIGTLGGAGSQAFDINNNGQIVGWSHTAVPGTQHAFLYSSGIMTDLGTLNGSIGTSAASAINDTGKIVGLASTVSGQLHAFLYQSGAMVDLGTCGGISSAAIAINNNDDVVGQCKTSTAADHAFLYSGGAMQDLNGLLPPNSGWVLYEALGINDDGWIVGSGTINNETHAYLMAPGC